MGLIPPHTFEAPARRQQGIAVEAFDSRESASALLGYITRRADEDLYYPLFFHPSASRAVPCCGKQHLISRSQPAKQPVEWPGWTHHPTPRLTTKNTDNAPRIIFKVINHSVLDGLQHEHGLLQKAA